MESGFLGRVTSMLHKNNNCICIYEVDQMKALAPPQCSFLMSETVVIWSWCSPHLTHEGWYHPVEDWVPKSETFLSGTESPEVFCCLGDNMGEKLDSDSAKCLPIGCHFEENPGVSVSGVLLNSGHLWCEGTWGIATGLVHAALTSAESLLEGLGYLSGFELGCQLLHYTVAIWKNRKKSKRPSARQC